MSEEANSDFLGPNFTNMKLVGTGGSGAVYSAIDVETDQRVAMKRLILRDQMNCRAALREIKVLKTLEHENIVKLSKVVDSEGLAFQDSATENFKEATELFLVEELLDSDLHHVLQSKGKLREDYVKLFLYQLLRGLKYVHSANVVHRDVKPSNILVDAETLLLRIGDFGRSRILDPAYSHNGHLTHSISSLWYKSPELLLNSSIYDSSVDMWAAGCVFAEMLLGKPLFEGRHEIDQMELILNSVCLTEEEWTQLKPQIPEKTALGKAQSQGSPLGSKFLHIDIQALDLLVKMLRFNPDRRITAEEALAHPYLHQYSFPSDEPICVEPLHIEDEVGDFKEDTLKSWILEECFSFESDSSFDITEQEPALQEVIIEKHDSSNDILSLKDIMKEPEDPILLDEWKLCDNVAERLGLDTRREGLETLAAAYKIQMTVDARDQEKVFELQHANMPSVFLDSVFGRGYLKENVNFTCKKNVFNGPFGMCYF
ncbi:Mitogen-activated protein kinase 6 [Desmophyllum pertusum]|uniref:Mitogen-activated protein kinase 6 n=1 Tax=Desmophyllum pertusum TaxID=174260 RepID=A0A9X0CNT7_9CNID|nr:Mitogen-activated protein kinase 6 [Desmophyllum pertusum]